MYIKCYVIVELNARRAIRTVLRFIAHNAQCSKTHPSTVLHVTRNSHRRHWPHERLRRP